MGMTPMRMLTTSIQIVTKKAKGETWETSKKQSIFLEIGKTWITSRCLLFNFLNAFEAK